MSDRTPREQLLADLMALRDRHPVTSRHWRRVQDVREQLWRCWASRDANRDLQARIAHTAACAEVTYLKNEAIEWRVRSAAVL